MRASLETGSRSHCARARESRNGTGLTTNRGNRLDLSFPFFPSFFFFFLFYPYVLPGRFYFRIKTPACARARDFKRESLKYKCPYTGCPRRYFVLRRNGNAEDYILKGTAGAAAAAFSARKAHKSSRVCYYDLRARRYPERFLDTRGDQESHFRVNTQPRRRSH